jgi:hypothetical protein
MMSRKVGVAVLAGFYPAIFFLSNNWHIFSIEQSLVLLVGTCLVSLALLLPMSYLLIYILEKVAGEKFPGVESSGGRDLFFNAALTVFALIFSIFLLRNTFASIEIQTVLLYAIIAAILVCFSYISLKRGLKPVLYTLVILSSLSIVTLFLNLYTETEVPIEYWTSKNKATYDQIKFRKTPNVYLIITESYPNKPALKAVYGIDNASFYNEMRNLGFKFNHDHFSNYNHTLSSLPSLFGMEHHYGIIHMVSFDSFGGRRMLEAKIYNPVIDIFRSNNYKIQYLHTVSGLIPNGADVDFYFPSRSFLHGLRVFLTKQDIIETAPSNRKGSEPIVSIQNQISSTSQSNNSYFNFIYLHYPNHSPSRLKAKSEKIINQKLGEFRDTYYQKIESANQQLLKFMNFIIEKDPDSIVILLGDHGSWGFRNKKDTQSRPISNQLYTLDRFGVLAGIRGPDELSDLMENGTIKSHINLFRYVFAHLSDDQTILSTKAPDDSYDQPFLMAIKDGTILDNYITVKLKKGKKP